jgi:hypothetical protein
VSALTGTIVGVSTITRSITDVYKLIRSVAGGYTLTGSIIGVYTLYVNIINVYTLTGSLISNHHLAVTQMLHNLEVTAIQNVSPVQLLLTVVCGKFAAVRLVPTAIACQARPSIRRAVVIAYTCSAIARYVEDSIISTSPDTTPLVFTATTQHKTHCSSPTTVL